jgi:hypothetical protein
MSAARSKQTRARLTFAPPPPPDPLPNRCEYAEGFFTICTRVLEKARKAPSELAVNQALLQLQNQCWLHYEDAPKAHKNHIGTRSTHSCLHQVYAYGYRELRDLLRAVNPPPVRRQSQRMADPRPQIAGIFLGEEVSGP